MRIDQSIDHERLNVMARDHHKRRQTKPSVNTGDQRLKVENADNMNISRNGIGFEPVPPGSKPCIAVDAGHDASVSCRKIQGIGGLSTQPLRWEQSMQPSLHSLQKDLSLQVEGVAALERSDQEIQEQCLSG